MKKFNLAEAQQKQRAIEEEAWVRSLPCVICQKMLKGPYGRHVVDSKEVWTCSLDHEKEHYASTGRQPFVCTSPNY